MRNQIGTTHFWEPIGLENSLFEIIELNRPNLNYYYFTDVDDYFVMRSSSFLTAFQGRIFGSFGKLGLGKYVLLVWVVTTSLLGHAGPFQLDRTRVQKEQSGITLCDVSRRKMEIFSCLHRLLPQMAKYKRWEMNPCQIRTKERTAQQEVLSNQSIHHNVTEFFVPVFLKSKLTIRYKLRYWRSLPKVFNNGPHSTHNGYHRVQSSSDVEQGQEAVHLQFWNFVILSLMVSNFKILH